MMDVVGERMVAAVGKERESMKGLGKVGDAENCKAGLTLGEQVLQTGVYAITTSVALR